MDSTALLLPAPQATAVFPVNLWRSAPGDIKCIRHWQFVACRGIHRRGPARTGGSHPGLYRVEAEDDAKDPTSNRSLPALLSPSVPATLQDVPLNGEAARAEGQERYLQQAMSAVLCAAASMP
jgi:hypothetical protein